MQRSIACIIAVALCTGCTVDGEEHSLEDAMHIAEEILAELGEEGVGEVEDVKDVKDVKDVEDIEDIEELEEIKSERSRQEQLPQVEQVPAKLSIEHFAHMKLEGADLQLTQLSRNEHYTRYAIEYTSNDLRISGIMNIPHGDGPYPLLVLNHGYIDPSIYTRGRGLKREQDALARAGFAVIHSDYRGHGASDPSPDTRMVYDATLEYSMDVINAINAVRAANLPSVDTERIGMLGHSMGGGITMNIAVSHPDAIDAIVLYAPVHTKAWNNFTRWEKKREEGDRTREVLQTARTNPDAWDQLSSWTYLDRTQAPIILFHGTQDKDVPLQWSQELSEELARLSKEHELVIFEGEKHEYINQWPMFMQRTQEFFREHLLQ